MKNAKLLLLLVLFGGWVMLAIATDYTQFNDNDISGNMSFVDVNSTVKYINLTTTKIKSANITMSGFVNLTQNTTFTSVRDNFGGEIQWNGTKFHHITYIVVGREAELVSTSDLSSDPSSSVDDSWNFTFIDLTSANHDDVSFAFNGSELYFLNNTNLTSIKLIRTNFPAKPVSIVGTSFNLPNDIRGITFGLNNSLYSCSSSEGLIRRHNKDNFSIIVENWSLTFPTACISITYDNTTLWVSGQGTNARPTRLNPNNFSVEDFRGTDTRARTFWDNKDLYAYSGIGSSVIKYFQRGFPFNLYINVGNDSTIEYTNLTENIKNVSVVSLDVEGFRRYTSLNCVEEYIKRNCTVPIIINSTSGKWAYSNIQISQNNIPNATNVSITELSIIAGNNLKGHANYSDLDNDVAGGNQTYWYVNKTIINEANNSFTLLGGNVTDNANITFSARFNDTYDWSDWKNSSTINVGDSTNPVLNNCTLSSTSITDASGNTINLSCDATDARSNIQTMVASLNGTINKTLTFSFTQSLNIIATRTIFQSEETLLVGSYSINQVNVTDTSTNKLSNTTKDLHFTVTLAPLGGGGTTGGGGGNTIIILENQNQTSLFFGFTTFSFFVISTPSEQIKLIKFKNIGNATFQDANVAVLGGASKFITASICHINQTEICKTENINIFAGENKFLKLDAKFTSELGLGNEGIIRMESLANSKKEGKIVDLLLSIDRPPAYRVLIMPISHLSPYKQFIGDNELPALIIGYGLFVLVLMFGINIIRSAL